MHGSFDLTLGEDRNVPTVRVALHRDALDLPVDEAAAAISYPPDLREIDLSARFIHLEPLREAD